MALIQCALVCCDTEFMPSSANAMYCSGECRAVASILTTASDISERRRRGESARQIGVAYGWTFQYSKLKIRRLRTYAQKYPLVAEATGIF